MRWFRKSQCEKIISHQGTKLIFKGIKVPVAEFEVGELQINKEQLQIATQLAQLLDAGQFAQCKLIEQINDNKNLKEEMIKKQSDRLDRLTNLAILLSQLSSNPSQQILDAIASWIKENSIVTKKTREDISKDVDNSGSKLPENITRGIDLHLKVSYVLDIEIIRSEGVLVAHSLDEIRKATMVEKLPVSESDKEILELPNGVFGYEVPWGIEWKEKMTLSSSSGGTAVLEVHKSKEGIVFIVGFVDKEVLPELKISFFPEGPFDKSRDVAAIPLELIKKIRLRNLH